MPLSSLEEKRLLQAAEFNDRRSNKDEHFGIYFSIRILLEKHSHKRQFCQPWNAVIIIRMGLFEYPADYNSIGIVYQHRSRHRILGN